LKTKTTDHKDWIVLANLTLELDFWSLSKLDLGFVSV